MVASTHIDRVSVDLARALRGYELDRFLDRRGEELHFLARERRTGRSAVLEVLPAGAQTPKSRRQFERTTRARARLTHPAIARVLAAGEARGHLYRSREFVRGARMHPSGPSAPAAAARVATQVDALLRHAKRRGVVADDLRLDDVFLDAHGRVRITGFDVAAPHRSVERAHADSVRSVLDGLLRPERAVAPPAPGPAAEQSSAEAAPAERPRRGVFFYVGAGVFAFLFGALLALVAGF